MAKNQAKALEQAEDQLTLQMAHVVRMIDARQPEAAIRAAKRLVYVFQMKVDHLESGKSETTFDIAAAGAIALKHLPHVGVAAKAAR